ncbi:MAG TPA: CoA-binding protein, partial [archaeon]|nr:CoA-binding protein [archaeon]
IVLFQTPLLTADVVEVVAEEAEKRSKPVIVISAGGRYTEVLKKSLEDLGIPTFSYPERAAEAIKALVAAAPKRK